MPSLADAMACCARKPRSRRLPHWVRVVGGFSEHQFAEKRLPTLDELNAAAPDTPVFILHLYDRALAQRAALRAVGYTARHAEPTGRRDRARREWRPDRTCCWRSPTPLILYATLAKGPKLPLEYQLNSTRHFMREMNRLGVTSVIDAGGGFQNYPDDYAVIEQLHRREPADAAHRLQPVHSEEGRRGNGLPALGRKLVKPGQGDDRYRHNGAGEMLVFSAADFEDFREPRPELGPEMEGELESRDPDAGREPLAVADARDLRRDDRSRPGRLRAGHPRDSVRRPALVLRPRRDDQPDATSIASRRSAAASPCSTGWPIRASTSWPATAPRRPRRRRRSSGCWPQGIPVGAGTDATRVASYNPWVSLSWLVTGKTVGGLSLYPVANTLDREQALRLWTESNTWFSSEGGKKGLIKIGQLADLAVLSEDYFTVPEDAIAGLESVLTLLGGEPVFGAGEFEGLAPPAPPVLPDWSPVKTFGGYQRRGSKNPARMQSVACGCSSRCNVHGHAHAKAWASAAPVTDAQRFWGVFGCACWAV